MLLLLVVASLTVHWVHRAPAPRVPVVPAEQRAATTLADLGAPVAASQAHPVVTYHWPSCEQGDCYNKARTFTLSRLTPLDQVGTALDAWASAHGLTDAGVADCDPPAQPRVLPEEYDCARTWYAGDRDGPLVTVWAHFADRGTVVGGSQQLGVPAWTHYAHEQVVELVVDVVDSDPLPQ